MVRNVMESDFLVILSTILWTKMVGQPFLAHKYPMVVIYFFKLYWFEMARNALKVIFVHPKGVSHWGTSHWVMDSPPAFVD